MPRKNLKITIGGCLSTLLLAGACQTGAEEGSVVEKEAVSIQGPNGLATAIQRSQIRQDEEVQLFPVMASFDDEKRIWNIPVHGWIYEREVNELQRKTLMGGLLKIFGPEPLQGKLFESRLMPFLYDNERGKELDIVLASQLIRTEPSESNGHFFGAGKISAVEVREFAQLATRDETANFPLMQLREQVVVKVKDSRNFVGRAFLLEAKGMTIISDIDDTVKVSHVGDTKRLLQSAFLEPYQSVPEMAETYQKWMNAFPNSHLHFVSSSPWQLFSSLEGMLRASRFPPASFHLKSIRWKDSSLMDLFSDPLEAKQTAIESVIRRFPKRHYILVGDSGEKDPEVYGELARRYPKNILYIAIRNVTGGKRESTRLYRAFRGTGVPWELFENPLSLKGPPMGKR